MQRLIISITLVTSLLASTTLSIPQQQKQRKSQQPRDTPEDGSRTSAGDQSAGLQFQCPEQFGYYMDTRDCTKYYVCVFGEVLHESCTGGLRFSRELQTCDWPRNVECKQDNMTAASLTATERSPMQELSSVVGNKQQAAEASSPASSLRDEQATTGGGVGQQPAATTTSEERSLKGSQMVFADEGSDPQQPSFDETVSPVITPDGTIHLHDGSGGTFGLGRAPPLDSGQSVDVFVKPMASVPASRQRQQTNQQRPTGSSMKALQQQQQQQANSRQPQLSGSGEEARGASSQPVGAAGVNEVESGSEQPTESSDSVASGTDNGPGESSTVDSAPMADTDESAASREATDESELEGDSDDGATGAPTTGGYVPPFSGAQHVAGAGSGRQQAENSPTSVADRDGVSFDFSEDGAVSGGRVSGGGSGGGGGDASGGGGATDASVASHPAESQQVSPARDNEAAQARQDEEEELHQHQQQQAKQSQRRQNQTQSLHPHLHHQQQQQQQQKGLSSVPGQQTVAQDNRQSRMSNIQQQQALRAQHHHLLLAGSLLDGGAQQQAASRGFPAPGRAGAGQQQPASAGERHHQYQSSVNFNDSSKLIRLQAASHQLVEHPGLLDESSSMQNDAATSFPQQQQQQFPLPRSQSLLFSERPPFASTESHLSSSAVDRSMKLVDEGGVTRAQSSSSLAASPRQRFLDTSEPHQSFMAAPRRPRPPKRQQIPSGGARPAPLPPNSFRPTNFSSPFHSHHHNPSQTSTGSPGDSFLLSRDSPTPFVESDALAGGPPMMMMRGPPGGWVGQQRPAAGGQSRAGTGLGAAGSRRPGAGGSRHFSEPGAASGARSQGQQQQQQHDHLSSIVAGQAPPPAMTTTARSPAQQQARRAHSNQLQLHLQPSLGSATTSAGSASLPAPTPATTAPTTTTASATSQQQPLASTGSPAGLAGSTGGPAPSQQEQDPQLVANRYLNSAIDALEAGQPFGAVDYDFEILNDNLSDRRNPSGSGAVSQQQQRPAGSGRGRAQPAGQRSQSGFGEGGRARQQLQRLQLPVGAAGNRSALLLFNPNKQMDSAAASRAANRPSNRQEEGAAEEADEEERVSLANGQPVAGERPPDHATGSGGRGGQQQQQLPAANRHSFTAHSSKPLPSSSPVVFSAAATGGQPSQQQQQQDGSRPQAQPSSSSPSSSTRKPRPTNKKIIVDHEQALANNRASVEPARRPEPLFATPTAIQTATKCDNRVCKLPDCKCGDTLVPGGLDPKAIPQVVLLTFDDAVNELNWEIYEELFTGRTNPNGCPILATFYVSHEWTDYGQVQTLYSRGHEIASHSVTHSFGEKFSKNQWFKEVNGQREILNMYGGVKMNDVRGMRAPFLQIGGNKMFEMLYDANFTYDSSMPIFDNLPPMWPYTLDYQLSHECMITPCPTKSFPGVWEVGMTMWVDLRGGRCSMGDACSNPADEDGVHEMLMKNFNRHYKSNRAPFGLFYHSAWFNTVHHRRGFLKFLATVNSMSDVYFVTNWQMLQWMRKPTPLSEINSFEPWQCSAKSDRPPPCFHPSVCNVKSEHGTRFMKTCQPCPANHQYPWVGATGFKGKQASLGGSG